MHTNESKEDIASFGNVIDSFELQKLKTKGWIMLENVAPSKDLVEAILSPIGSLMPQYGQMKFWDVKAKEANQGTSLGDQMLRLHTELAEFQQPPEYVALYSVQPAEIGGALRLFDSRPFLASLKPDEINELLSESMTVAAEQPIAEHFGSYSYTAPILSTSPTGLCLRFDQKFIEASSSEKITSFRDALVNFSENRCLEIKQKKGSLIIWDNRFMLHGRSQFQGSDRLLWRCCIKAN